ncbi:MAG: cytochrome c oxidase subunit I [Gammaproteobacteria bacterium]|nr:MAG: cytochrome c oxidase subunit I [Gammaproteobacteria bacterium]
MYKVNMMSEIETKPSNNPIAVSKRNPYTVWFVVLAFIAPVALAYIIFFFVDVKSFVNHGEILNPIVHISSFELKNADGEIIPVEELTYKWRIISFVGKDCDQRCEKRLYDTRQIHTSLGKDQHRLVRMFVHLAPAGESLSKLIAETHPAVVQVNGDAKIIINALGDNIRNAAGITNNEIYVMDPMGNVMMRFTQEQPNKDFLYDLKKLLKASQIG